MFLNKKAAVSALLAASDVTLAANIARSADGKADRAITAAQVSLP